MKIAVATENGTTISNHFGRAPFYLVYTIQHGDIVTEEKRPKPHHEGSREHLHSNQHKPHENMFSPIADCEILICGGMGEPAFQKALAAGLEIFLTGGDIYEAVDAYLANNLASDMRRIHQH